MSKLNPAEHRTANELLRHPPHIEEWSLYWCINSSGVHLYETDGEWDHGAIYRKELARERQDSDILEAVFKCWQTCKKESLRWREYEAQS